MPKTWDIVDLARMAAFIDGEGSITISERNGPKSRQAAARMSLMLTVSNTDCRLAEWCKSVFGGSVRAAHPRANSFSRRPVYVWTVGALLAEEVIEACLPFFVIKKEQADLALQFRSTYNKYHKHNPIPDDVRADRVEMKGKLMQMHRNGVA